MNQTTFSVLAIIGGVFLAAQGALNSTLSVLLKNPLLASVIAFLTSTIFAIIFVLLSTKSLPNASDLKQIPIYLWFSGGLFSVLGISLYYYTIPKLGISTMISFGLFGQLTFSIIAGHFGWLNLPLEPLTFKRLLGFFVMMFGIILINIK
ncbi:MULTISPECIES: DMT family transporter [unclassified Cellulophaga]|uniref:DMT family transporter n=2 Tax=Pseudomonadati TaxID=3379134 RepID=UPI000C2BE1C9|nr:MULTISPECIES: DMT family transporter [unclassified Cellulophaga]MDO6491646.1 DMT family transporter [Cellulophaga sp. 2_MG-2023]MDO6493523.1 DMT family transporter [Cellulophaga sp. 3_MG-2023]PKB44492.1 transporter family-2 protein [Cellulophaga sp. RHA19]